MVTTLRIFLSSPGDVASERAIAREIISQLDHDPLLRETVNIQVIAWDEPSTRTPMIATLPPQEAINRNLPKPSECDIVIVVFWSRMGTPLPFPDYKKPDGTRYLSGTEWEYIDAVQGARQNPTGLPLIALYRRIDKVLLEADDPAFNAKREQYQFVKEFFDRFHAPDGSILGGYNPYKKPHDFQKIFENDIRDLVKQVLSKTPVLVELALPQKPPDHFVPVWKGSPFPGLKAFTEQQAPIFFGRGHETDELIIKLERYNMVAVIGASGSGKSSLVRAGLIPRLRNNAISSDTIGSKDWFFVSFQPDASNTGNPFDSLAAALITNLPILLEHKSQFALHKRELATELEKNPNALKDTCSIVLAEQPQWSEIILFVDQFEELFTVIKQNYQQQFIDLIHNAIESKRIRIIITLRADFYGECIKHSKLAHLLENAQFPLSAPELDAMREMIVRPAQLTGVDFEDRLPERILNDTGTEPGALALMAYTLDELYREGKAHGKLTIESYHSLGGVQGAISKRAESTFSSLSHDSKQSLHRIFRNLVEVDENGTAVRQRTRLNYIADTEPALLAITAFTEARLLVQSSDDQDQPIVEIAHEALLSSWDRLRSWIETDLEFMLWRRRLRSALSEWEHTEHDPGSFLRGAALAEAEQWLRIRTSDLRQTEISFIEISIAERENEARRKARQVAFQRRLIAVLAVLLIVAAGLGVVSLISQQQYQQAASEALTQAAIATASQGEAVSAQATAERNSEESKSLALAESARIAFEENDLLQALDLAIEANGIIDPPVQAQRALTEYAYQPGPRLVLNLNTPSTVRKVNSVAFSPDGNVIISAIETGEVVGFDLDTRSFFALTGHTSEVTSVDYSADGRFIVSGSVDGTAILWNAESLEEIYRVSGHVGAINCIAFSPDGDSFVTASDDKTLVLWDTETGDPYRRFVGHSYEVLSAAFSPDGIHLLSGENNNSTSPTKLLLWNVNSGQSIRDFRGQRPGFGIGMHWGPISAVDFSPDGQTAVSASSFESRIILWDVENGMPIRQFSPGLANDNFRILYGERSGVSSVSFSPDGQTFVSGSNYNTFVLWNVANSEPIDTFSIGSSITSLTFRPNDQKRKEGHSVVVGLENGYSLLWSIEQSQIIRRFTGHDGAVLDISISSDGQTMIAGSVNNQIIVWETHTGRIRQRLQSDFGSSDRISDLDVAPDSQTFLAASSSGSISLWDIDLGILLRYFRAHTGPVNGIAFSPDGRTALSGSSDETLILWDVESGQVIRRFTGHTGSVNSVAFSPDGRTALSGSSDETLILWDVESGQVIHRFTGHTGSVNGIAFSPDGRTALSGSSDETLILWDIETQEIIYRFWGHTGAINSVTFGFGGLTALSGSEDGTIILWDVKTGKELRQFLGHLASVSSVLFNSDGPAILSGSSDNTVIQWRFDELDELIQWTFQNRFVDEFDCAERIEFGIEPLCDANDIYPTRTPFLTWTPSATPAPSQTVDLTEITATYTPTVTPTLPTLTPTPTYSPTPTLDLTNITATFGPLLPTATATPTPTIGPTIPTVTPSTVSITPEKTTPSFGSLLATATRSPTATAASLRALIEGTHEGFIPVGGGELWFYEGTSGEIVTLSVKASNPANQFNEQFQQANGLLDTIIYVRDPNGDVIAEADDIYPGVFSDSSISRLALPMDGTYEVEIRSWMNKTGGSYSLEFTVN